MKHDFINTLTFKKVKKSLDLPEWQCIGIIEAVINLCLHDRCDGVIGIISNEDIAFIIGFDPTKIDLVIDKLLKSGFLSSHKEYRLIINDWKEIHAPGWAKKRMANKKRAKVSQVRQDGIREAKVSKSETTETERRVREGKVREGKGISTTAKTSGDDLCKSNFNFPLKNGKSWNLPEKLLLEFKQAFGSKIDVEETLGRSRMWLVSNSLKCKTDRGMPKFLNNWLTKSFSDAAKNQPTTPNEIQHEDMSEL